MLQVVVEQLVIIDQLKLYTAHFHVSQAEHIGVLEHDLVHIGDRILMLGCEKRTNQVMDDTA